MIAASVLAAMFAAAPIEVHTATRDVRGCQALERGYVAASEGGVVFLDAAGVAEPALTALDGLPETRSYVVAPVAGSSTQVWAGTEGGLARIEHDQAGARVIEVIESAPLRALVQHAGHTYVGTWGEGVFELVQAELVAIAGPELAKADRITDLAWHRDHLVVASAGAGAWILAGQPEPLAGVEGIVWSLAVHDDQLYAGTFVGVLELGASDARTLATQDARALASVGGELWIGSHGQGLIRLDEDGGEGEALLPELTHVQGLDGDRCVATSQGLWIHGGARWTRTLADGLPSGDISAMVEHEGRLVVGTFDRGVMIHDAGRWIPLDDPQQTIDPQINALVAAPEGRLWIATARGLFRKDERTGQVQRWTSKTGLPHDSVLSLALTRQGELVVGTHAGVVIVDAAGEVRSLGARAGRWATWAIAEADDGSLWLGTTQGLVRWHAESGSHYSMLSGHLDDNWVTALQVEGDHVHVGTYAGGVMRLTKVDATRWRSESLGGGRVNPGGLRLVDGRLHASTMKGLLVRDHDRWRSEGELPFEDVTGVLEVDRGLWIATRRGLVLHQAASVKQRSNQAG